MEICQIVGRMNKLKWGREMVSRHHIDNESTQSQISKSIRDSSVMARLQFNWLSGKLVGDCSRFFN